MLLLLLLLYYIVAKGLKKNYIYIITEVKKKLRVKFVFRLITQ